jgi:putative FmdB family regulatory protein
MPLYHYKCRECSHEFLTKRGMTETPIRMCPECGMETLETVFHAVMVLDLTPKTIGGQADKNTTRMGLYEVQEKRHELQLLKQRGRREMNLPTGMESARPEKPETPWWRPGTTGPDMALTKLTPEQKAEFVEEGRV